VLKRLIRAQKKSGKSLKQANRKQRWKKIAAFRTNSVSSPLVRYLRRRLCESIVC